MQFFDLNIPYLESDKNIPNRKSKLSIRLQTMVKSMELGYTGIAYNRTIEGIMSQSDGCTITPFPLSSLLNHHATLSSSASFHRKLLGVPDGVPFRQYTRLTVHVETDAQSSALNSGNPVLKTYHLVAVRPLSQKTFEHACQSAQADIITIDFGEKLPFRLKLPMVRAAIARGVYFEIMYSSFLEDAHVRRQMIATAKLLVEWTRGRNLIVSSGAPSALELRGPNDVSNLLHLLGLSSEHAKAALSKNCRLLIASAVRKKQFYKEAIRVEMMPVSGRNDPEKPWMPVNFNWDPLSSGEGDLLLEDLAKSFTELGNASQTLKAIDFTSLVDNEPSRGSLATATGARFEGICHSSGDVVDFQSCSKDLEVAIETDKLQKGLESLSTSLLHQQGNADENAGQAKESPNNDGFIKYSSAVLENLNEIDVVEAAPTRLYETGVLCRADTHGEDLVCDNVIESSSTNVALEVKSVSTDKISIRSEFLNQDGMHTCSRLLGSGLFSASRSTSSVEQIFCDHSEPLPSSDLSLGSSLLQPKQDPACDIVSAEYAGKTIDVDSFIENTADGLVSGNVERVDVEQLAEVMEQSHVQPDEKMDVGSFVERSSNDEIALRDLTCVEGVSEEQEQNEAPKLEVDAKYRSADDMMQVDSFYQGKDDSHSSVANSMNANELLLQSRKRVEKFCKVKQQSAPVEKSSKHKVKLSTSSQVLRFPFKRLWQVRLKKKGGQSFQ